MVRELVEKQETVVYCYSNIQEAYIHVSEMRDDGYGIMYEDNTIHGYMIKYFKTIK